MQHVFGCDHCLGSSLRCTSGRSLHRVGYFAYCIQFSLCTCMYCNNMSKLVLFIIVPYSCQAPRSNLLHFLDEDVSKSRCLGTIPVPRLNSISLLLLPTTSSQADMHSTRRTADDGIYTLTSVTAYLWKMHDDGPIGSMPLPLARSMIHHALTTGEEYKLTSPFQIKVLTLSDSY